MSLVVYLRRTFIATLIAGVAVLFLLSYLWQDGGSPPTRQDLIKFLAIENTSNHAASLLHQPRIGCSSVGVSDVQLVIIVVSKASYAGHRQGIRQTWGSKAIQRKYGVRIYFLVGKKIGTESENRIHGDIIQIDLVEDYYKLSNKTIAAFQWVTKFCSNARYFFKCDDDIFLNIKRLMYIVKQPEFPNDQIVGRCFILSRPFRHTFSKWKASYETYPYEFYPPYCSGSGYVMSMNTTKTLYKAMKRTKVFIYEDIYVGMVAYNLGIKIKNINHFGYEYSKTKKYNYNAFMLYFYHKCVAIQHRVSLADRDKLWQQYAADEDEPAPSYC